MTNSSYTFADFATNDLTTFEWDDKFADLCADWDNNGVSHTFTKVDGTEILLSSDGCIYDANTLRKRSNTGKCKSGYVTTSVKGKTYYLHRLIAEAFIPNWDDLDTVDHIHPNKNDNSVDNLQWMSLENNIRKGNKSE